MRGILLAGGTGACLFPLTRSLDQYLLPVGKYPMILHPLERLKKAGIKQVLIVAGREALGPIIGMLGSGAAYGLDLQYRVREKPAENQAGTLMDLELAADYARGESILAVLGNQIFRDDLSEAVTAFHNRPSGARIFIKEGLNQMGSLFAELDSNQLLRIRPNNSEGAFNHCVTGIYIFDPRFFDLITKLRISGRAMGKELEMVEVLNSYLNQGELGFQELQDWWVEVETFETLELANRYAQGVELEL